MTKAPGWEDILDEGETILWQGRPDASIQFRPRHILSGLFGLLFAGFALFWMSLAASAGGTIWMYGLIHFSVGMGIFLGPILWPAWRRKHTWYTLSNARAFIATDMPFKGRRLDAYPLTPDTVLSFDNNEPGTIHFAKEYRSSKSGTKSVDLGFERIPDAAQVYRQIRSVQRGAP